jgi:hypothetical protein
MGVPVPATVPELEAQTDETDPSVATFLALAEGGATGPQNAAHRRRDRPDTGSPAESPPFTPYLAGSLIQSLVHYRAAMSLLAYSTASRIMAGLFHRAEVIAPALSVMLFASRNRIPPLL